MVTMCQAKLLSAYSPRFLFYLFIYFYDVAGKQVNRVIVDDGNAVYFVYTKTITLRIFTRVGNDNRKRFLLSTLCG